MVTNDQEFAAAVLITIQTALFKDLESIANGNDAEMLNFIKPSILAIAENFFPECTFINAMNECPCRVTKSRVTAVSSGYNPMVRYVDLDARGCYKGKAGLVLTMETRTIASGNVSLLTTERCCFYCIFTSWHWNLFKWEWAFTRNSCTIIHGTQLW